ncbi:MAG: hypothetical protein ABIJ91_05355 [Candidatus Kuenenbacteria bacterium]
MKKKYIAYGILPVLALALAGTASAHGLWGGFRNATPQEIAQHQTERFQNQSDLLGVSVDEVKSAWAQGKTMRELAEEKGISQEDLHAKIKAAREQRMKDYVQALVDNGVITQEQANQRLEFMQNQDFSRKIWWGMHRGFGF